MRRAPPATGFAAGGDLVAFNPAPAGGNVGETRVDLEHLLEDIRDAYPGSLEETIVTEIVANSLDSGATRIRPETDPASVTLVVVDDGSGMARRELARYHDIAASTKGRGEGIGFAGVGIKLGILASEEVFTETRRGKTHVATSWRLASRHKAPWRWVEPAGLVAGRGTAVKLRLRNPLSPLLERGFLEEALVRHFPSLFDPVFDEVLAAHYPQGVRFEVNGRMLPREAHAGDRAVLAIRLGRKRKPALVGVLSRATAPLAEEKPGVAVATLGKAIKRGWDWLGLSPGDASRITGLFEVPGLAECLTLNKADFIRTGPRGATYLGFRKAIQEAVSAQLTAWGDSPAAAIEEARQRRTRPMERDLAAVLLDLTDDFPLVASLVERRAGGQKRLPIGRGGTGDMPGSTSVALGAGGTADPSRAHSRGPEEAASPVVRAETSIDGTEPAESSPGTTGPCGAAGSVAWPTAAGRRRPAHLGLAIRFESRAGDDSLGRLVDSTVWVNESHPAYRRAAATRSDGYHLALCVALALAPLAVEPAQSQDFVTAFLTRWGAAVERPARGPGARGTRPRRERVRRRSSA